MRTQHFVSALILNFALLSIAIASGPVQVQPAGSHLATIQMATENRGIKELGLLKQVEDSGYPFVTLTIEFPERNFTEVFGLNLEEVKNVDAQKLNAWVGKYVAFDYDSDIVNALMDLKRGGQSILDTDVYTKNADTKVIKGILSGAEEVTSGDLPGEILITTEEGITMSFAFFIDEKIVAVNGKKVVAFYEERTQNTINEIRLSK